MILYVLFYILHPNNKLYNKVHLRKLVTIIIITSFIFATIGALNVGFDIDDTILFSRDVFQSIPKNKRHPIDYSWVNKQDEKLSIFIDPTVDLVALVFLASLYTQ